jgi:predicted SnoaL-like aldol condensation-catalyzing enzyme
MRLPDHSRKMSQTLQEKNKALRIEGFDTLSNTREFAKAEKYWSPNYIQHSAHIEPGRDGLFNLVKSLPASAKWEHGIMMAEGDYVMVHSRYTNPDGSAIVVVDIMRIKDGVFESSGPVLMKPLVSSMTQRSSQAVLGSAPVMPNM